MPNFYKFELSGSVDGRPIPIVATGNGTTGTGIHVATTTAYSDGNEYDEVWVWAANYDASARTIGIQLGGTASSDIYHTNVPPQGGGPVLVVPGLVLQNGVVLRATASVASALLVFGYVNRIARN